MLSAYVAAAPCPLRQDSVLPPCTTPPPSLESMLRLSAQPGPLQGAAHLHSPLSITLLSCCSWGAAAGEEGREPLSPQGTSSPRPQELRLLLCHHPPAAIPGGRGEGQSLHTALRRAGTQGGAQQLSGHPTTTPAAVRAGCVGGWPVALQLCLAQRCTGQRSQPARKHRDVILPSAGIQTSTQT